MTAGVEFTRVPRGADWSAGRWNQPWIVVWATPGYSARTGLWRLRAGGLEEAVGGARERGGKRGYRLSDLAPGVYVVRTAHADRLGQHEHLVLIEPGGVRAITPEQSVMEVLRYGG